MQPPLLALEHITFAYDAAHPLFQDLNLTLHEGEHMGFFGHNGQGKTSLFRLITGLERPSSGTIAFQGTPVVTEQDFQTLRRRTGFVLQHAEDQLFCPTVLDDVAFGLLNLGLSADEARERSLAQLASLGLAGFEDRLTHRLSGGEKKLVSLAGVLVMEPQLLLFDEPTSTLDPRARERLQDIITDLPQARIIISHDRRFLEATSDRFMTLRDGRIVHTDCASFFA
ncbi:MAG TPA: energy-coupling factor ABC transporter ATP-binding protein [Candidatus Desulfovibrio intestinipullorum]|uniref:Energy-coupling factor ABC transporter ATP-binding protein n=1 Tax=Candidatus Desulfovibrio intestinipullorum TaxID=2838536 RepID=A0A9D1TPC0_9BACT|nr:energy-coupling factor ABC transporter ATP-binding protein [Candidatus Desulfovibrio intestinipullorum]